MLLERADGVHGRLLAQWEDFLRICVGGQVAARSGEAVPIRIKPSEYGAARAGVQYDKQKSIPGPSCDVLSLPHKA